MSGSKSARVLTLVVLIFGALFQSTSLSKARPVASHDAAVGLSPESTHIKSQVQPPINIVLSDMQMLCATTVQGTMKALVTGSAGFIGFHVCKALKARQGTISEQKS